ncbi:hypothetical protein BV25DRAFT_1843839, partial [Artomyces pyxidatus]
IPSLVVGPPLSSNGGIIYLHTTALLEVVDNTRTGLEDHGSPLQLDDTNLQTFCRLVRQTFIHDREAEYAQRTGGGDQEVGGNWRTWTAEPPERRIRDSASYYEYLPFSFPPSLKLPKWFVSQHVLLPHAPNSIPSRLLVVRSGERDRVDDGFARVRIVRENRDLQRAKEKLHHIKTPPGCPDPDSCWEEDPPPKFCYTPESITVIPFSNVRVITLDLFGTIIDRTTSVQRPIASLTPNLIHNFKYTP